MSSREVVTVGGAIIGKRIRPILLVGVVALLTSSGMQAAHAHRTALVVEIVSEQSTVSPDGRSMTFDLSTTCDRTWTVVEATVNVTQANASGTGSFVPNCGRIPYVVPVTVPVLQGVFQTGPTQASAILVVQQGPTKQAQDSASLRARPSVSVLLADRAVLEGDGAVRIDVTVTCPMSAAGQGGQVRIYDGQILGTGTFGPTPCDALPHTVSVRVASPGGSFQLGSAEAEAFASVVEGGDVFPGGDLRTIQIAAV
jgi:hypothetical protein